METRRVEEIQSEDDDWPSRQYLPRSSSVPSSIASSQNDFEKIAPTYSFNQIFLWPFLAGLAQGLGQALARWIISRPGGWWKWWETPQKTLTVGAQKPLISRDS